MHGSPGTVDLLRRRGAMTARCSPRPARAWIDSRSVRLALLLLVVTWGGCAGPAVSIGPPPRDAAVTGPLTDLWVIRHRWHTAVALRLTDVERRTWPESNDLGPGAYIEAGWGDRDFYSKRTPSLWDAVDPVVRATPAALHIGVFDVAPHELFAAEDVVRLSVPVAGVQHLARFVHAHYVHDEAGMSVRIGAGYYPRSAFYLARGRYHALTFNSNHWTASALRTAGVPTEPSSATTAAAVMRQAADIAAAQHERGAVAAHPPP